MEPIKDCLIKRCCEGTQSAQETELLHKAAGAMLCGAILDQLELQLADREVPPRRREAVPALAQRRDPLPRRRAVGVLVVAEHDHDGTARAERVVVPAQERGRQPAGRSLSAWEYRKRLSSKDFWIQFFKDAAKQPTRSPRRLCFCAQIRPVQLPGRL